MGDTGSLAIGGSLGLVAVMVRADLLMPLIGLVFLAEFASSVMQVLYFKATGRRILPIAPLHHIWQQRGVPEQRIVARFWLVGLAAALTPLVLL
jgi:phospho-N-acetylmuramoyl-pentapeptide-transferase